MLLHLSILMLLKGIRNNALVTNPDFLWLQKSGKIQSWASLLWNNVIIPKHAMFAWALTWENTCTRYSHAEKYKFRSTMLPLQAGHWKSRASLLWLSILSVVLEQSRINVGLEEGAFSKATSYYFLNAAILSEGKNTYSSWCLFLLPCHGIYGMKGQRSMLTFQGGTSNKEYRFKKIIEDISIQLRQIKLESNNQYALSLLRTQDLESS